jgi:multidrug efflux system membrane fusion protein
MPVQVDTTEGTDVILTSGVKAGDQLVTDGQEKLKNGSRVVPRKGVTSTGVQSAVVRENGRQQGGSAPAGAPGDPANPGAILPDAPTAPNGSNMSGSAGHTTGGGSGSGSSQGQPQ